MKIKIIASKPTDENCSDISNLINKEFDVLEVINENNMEIYANGYGTISIFPGEYEIIEN